MVVVEKQSTVPDKRIANRIVQKYGGSSLATPIHIQRVAKRIQSSVANGRQLIVVVSAMADTTDDLLELAHQVSKAPPHREIDMLISVGERISMALLTMALKDLGVAAISFTGSQVGIITTESHRRAKIQEIRGDRVTQSLNEGKVVIVAGFQGVSSSKEITTLGRGGSDTTAVALAAAFQADHCEIYTDVDGVYSGDPRIVGKEAVRWSQLPLDLALEFSRHGAGVLHGRCVELAKKYQIPVSILNSLVDESTGTELVMDLVESAQITGVTADLSKLGLHVSFQSTEKLAEWTGLLGNQELEIVDPTVVPDSEMKIQLYGWVEKEFQSEWDQFLARTKASHLIVESQWDQGWVPISVVGNCLSRVGQGLSAALDELKKHGIPTGRITASSLAFSVAVQENRAQESVRCLHRRMMKT